MMTAYTFVKSLEVLSIFKDFGTTNFNQKMGFFKNKIPLGNMRVPF